ncbi:hypothetical protein PHYSODRAFT_347981 [Phytophthora sojae]|uniref:START domain-containing protein n=1 Tax=Phytophthora sojae (strain P6497) TaxID=1094619 RepID=G5A6S2_PHYSP|nr:hypothetical protein PHYSODRAFT_347981 [Phytophthora sojae]EGZ09027.1 hypothetical protein PHYSODRAFT_347981 [Phytophthora sojae]|eukprot:XP_009535660.1 hypothetical protein PHYSODRAFT_347981 [Phytophthora sojae]
MTDSLCLDEVAGFLCTLDDPSISGHELLQSLDKDESLLSLQGTEIALQMLDVSPVDGLLEDPLFDSNSDQNHTDSDCTSAESESVASASSPPPVVENVRSRDAIRRSTYRQKQKAQKEELYRQVEQLSSQLAMLQQKKKDADASQGMGFAQTAVWKALANRHLQGRMIAEEQRRRLCEAVHRRSALIRDLGVIIRKRFSEEQPEEAGSATKRPRTESPDMALYQAYINELDEAYARTDSIFKETAAHREELECDDSFGFYNAPRAVVKDSRYHELVGKSTTPFAYERVHAQVGRVCCMENRMGRERIEGPWVPENTTIVKARVDIPVVAGSLVQHTVMRKYQEADRVVVVWRKFTEGKAEFAGMHSDETGWNIVRPSPSCVGGGAGTVLESVTRFVPINFSSAASTGVTVKQFADTIIKVGEEECQSCIEQLEKMLLDDALGEQSIESLRWLEVQKEQKRALYRQAEELSAQLAALQKRREATETSKEAGVGHAAVWKALAHRHLQARVNAEEQRRRLCKTVERRSALIRDLAVLIRKRISEEQPEEAGFTAKKPRTESPDVVLYEAFIEELDEVYARTDSIFKEAAVETDVDSCEDAQVFFNPSRTVKPNARYHELVGTMTTPFAFERVRALLDGTCRLANYPGYEAIEGSWIPEDTEITKSRIVGPGGNTLVQHSISRKFTEGEGAFTAMHLDETGWAIVRPSPSSGKGMPSTVMESVIRFVPINFSTAPASGTVLKQFTDTIVKIGEDICQTCLQKLDEVLLDDALGVY